MAGSTEPTYVRIAAELTRRIDQTELAPGDKVPSTRQIAQEFGVALATATKALDVLRAGGLVITRPRSGTVVAPARNMSSRVITWMAAGASLSGCQDLVTDETSILDSSSIDMWPRSSIDCTTRPIS